MKIKRNGRLKGLDSSELQDCLWMDLFMSNSTIFLLIKLKINDNQEKIQKLNIPEFWGKVNI